MFCVIISKQYLYFRDYDRSVFTSIILPASEKSGTIRLKRHVFFSSGRERINLIEWTQQTQGVKDESQNVRTVNKMSPV